MKKFVSGFLSLLMVFSVFTPVSAATDIDEDYRFYDEMQYLLEEGILTGFSDGTLRPNQIVTRAEAAIMIGRMEGWDGTKRDAPFTDVAAHQAASGYIASGAAAGVITGYSSEFFKPYAPVTRGDMAIFLARALELSGGVFSFEDVNSNMKAAPAIGSIVLEFITAGYPDGTYRPSEPITRGQFSAFLARALEPRFKNEVRMEGSFLRDMTKTYTYESNGTETVNSYKFVGDSEIYPPGFYWVNQTEGEEPGYYYELESPEALITAYPLSEYYVELEYPVREGKSFEVWRGGDDMETFVYSDTNVTVTTPYQTFSNAVEVTQEDGTKVYYVRGFNSVKTVAADGTVLSQLMNVE